MTLTTVPSEVADASNLNVKFTESIITPVSIKEARSPGSNTSLAVQYIEIRSDENNATNSAVLSRQKRDTFTTNTMTRTRITEINQMNLNYKGNPIQLSPTTEC